MNRLILLTFGTMLAIGSYAAQMISPNQKISADAVDGSITIKYLGQPILSIPAIGIGVGDAAPQPAKVLSICDSQPIYESYNMAVGKKSVCTNSANAYRLACTAADGYPQTVEMRLYDDGVAFRYVVDDLVGAKLSGEATTYLIPEGTRRWIQKWTEAYEEFFPLSTTGDYMTHKWGYPALIEPVDGVFALISEADIHRGHSASYLTNSPEQPELYHVSQDPNNVANNGSWTSPWRTVIIGGLPTVVESTLITDVSTPTAYTATDWISPGGVSWIYWAYNHGSNDLQIIKKYVDMAATLGLPYMLIDAEWDEMGNGGDINDALAYAHSKGVKPLLWYNSETGWPAEWGSPGPHGRLNDQADREKEYAWLEQNGVSGIKIDFFAGDKQETMDYCIDLLEDAAKHHLMVNFHGATIPRGWQRTYPNLMTVEGVYGAEWYNNRPTLTNRAAAHNATLPFTRNVIGPMDYTPTTFSDSQHPHITSNAHELALPVIFESALTHWADRPESYLAQPIKVQQFMSALPTVWDDTRLLGGYPGQYVVMARRSDDTWYVGAINGLDTPQTIELQWPILNDDVLYRVDTFADGTESEPWVLTTAQMTKGQMPATLTLHPRGGWIAVIR